jgi:hypothetical protein
MDFSTARVPSTTDKVRSYGDLEDGVEGMA